MKNTIIMLACILAGCAGGGSTGGGHMAKDTAVTGSRYIALDLTTREVTTVTESAGFAAAPCWRDTHMLFRRVDAGDTEVTNRGLGNAAFPVWGLDPIQHHELCWIGVFEVTRAQWRRITGTIDLDPRLATAPAPLVPATADNCPIAGLSSLEPQTVARSFAVNGWRLDLPTRSEWIGACANSGRVFSWGDSIDDIVVSTYANCVRSDGTTTGMQPVGLREPNSLGIYDLHGNAYELAVDIYDQPIICGGSWATPAAGCATSSMVAEVPLDLPHPELGARFVLRR
jgi:hypothetical protein